MKTYLRPSEAADVKLLAPILRESDIVELRDSTGQAPRQALEYALDKSDLAYSMFSNGSIICMGGVAASDYNADVGIAWFLASDRLQKSAVALQKFLPAVLKEMHKVYPSLANFVDARNTTSCAWLQRLGFKLVGTCEHYGVAGVPFHWFVRSNLKGKHRCVPLPQPS